MIFSWLRRFFAVPTMPALPVARPSNDFDALADMPFSYPPEVADVAEETFAGYLRLTEREYPHRRPSEQRHIAIMRAEANLSERAAFRREHAWVYEPVSRPVAECGGEAEE